MRGSTLVAGLVACVLLTAACGAVPDESAGGVAEPSTWDSAPATPYATPSETVPAARPSTPVPRRRPPAHRAAPRRAVPHRPVHHAPKAPAYPAGATAECRDGTFSHAAHHQGACSHHGGVLKFFR
jgi:Protein of unknown function (DUF3761)